MKKIFCLMLALALLAPVIALAEEAVGKEDAPMMTPPEMEKKCECAMCGCKMRCPMMGKATMVAGQDGGVIVLVGNKLQKYDNALNLVKEVTIAMPMPGLLGDKQCPIMPGMMKATADEKLEMEEKFQD